MTARHGPNTWQGYMDAHTSHLDGYRDGFLVSDELSIEQTPSAVFWTGRLVFQDGCEVHVERRQEAFERSGGRWVRTADYSYQVIQRRPNGTIRELWRYDNAHPREGHPDSHHRHDFARSKKGRVAHVGEANWPTLGDVIDELHAWWTQQATTRPAAC